MKKTGSYYMIFLLLLSCKVLKYDENMIVYDYLPEYGRTARIGGDAQHIDFFRGDEISVSPAYHRESRERFEGYRILFVNVIINKKYSFKNYGKVTSTEFGPFSISTNSKNRYISRNGVDYLDYYISLENLNIKERYERIQRDTIIVALGNLNFKFIPRIKNKG